MLTSQNQSTPEINRHRCRKCGEDLTNKPSIGGRYGNKCVRCFCQDAKVDEELFVEVIANRRCCQCDWEYDRNLAIAEIRMGEIRDERQCDWEYDRDLAIKPAIIQFENGTFRGLLCFRCRYEQDKDDDLANEKKKQLYEKQYAEWRSRYEKQDAERQNRYEKEYAEWQSQCVKEHTEWQNRCNKEYAEWETSRDGTQWKAQQGRVKYIEGFATLVGVIIFIILVCLIFNSTNMRSDRDRFEGVLYAFFGGGIAGYLVKEVLSGLSNVFASRSCPPPEKEPPPPAPPPPEKDPLPPLDPPPPDYTLPINTLFCGYPELLFDGNRAADLNPCFVQLELFDCNEEADLNPNFAGFENNKPPDWEERRKVCRQRDDFRCCICHKKEHKKKQHDVHHVIPKARRYQGSHSLQNLVTLCEDCHDAQEYYDHKYLLEKARSKKP